LEQIIALLPQLIPLFVSIIQAVPTLEPAIKNLITTIKAEINNVELTAEQKAGIDAEFDKIDAALEKACADRLALGDLEAK
jgi:hypothetical protein